MNHSDHIRSCALSLDFERAINSPNPLISERQVSATIDVSNRILLKYLNLFDVDPNRVTPYEEVPLVPMQAKYRQDRQRRRSALPTRNTADERKRRIVSETISCDIRKRRFLTNDGRFQRRSLPI